MADLKKINHDSFKNFSRSTCNSQNFSCIIKNANSFLLKASRHSPVIRFLYRNALSPVKVFIKYGRSDIFYYIKIKLNFLLLALFSFLGVGSKVTSAYVFPLNYKNWVQLNELNDNISQENGITTSSVSQSSIRFSIIIPIYKVEPDILKRTFSSVVNQTYSNWEICAAYSDIDSQVGLDIINYFAKNDSRIKIRLLESNLGISGNSMKALDLAAGDFVVLLDHDDELPCNVLSRISNYISRNPTGDFFYTDRDCININSSLRTDPLFKPQWSPELLISVNYLTHLNVIRRQLLNQIGGWRSEFDGAQDWDLFFRISQATKNIHRIEGIGYHWRLHNASTSLDLGVKPYAEAAQIKAIQDHISHLGLRAEVIKNFDGHYRLFWHNPIIRKVDLMIYRSEFSGKDLEFLISVVAEIGCYLNRIIFVADNKIVVPPDFILKEVTPFVFVPQSMDEIQKITDIMHERSEAIIYIGEGVYNFLEYSLIEMMSWILGHSEIGVVGGMLLDKKNVILEAGRIINTKNEHLPLYNGVNLNAWTFFGSTNWYRTVSAISPLFVAIKRSVCKNISFSDINEDLKFNKFCVNISEENHGLRVMLNPFARAHCHGLELKQAQNLEYSSCLNDKYFNSAFADSSTTKLKNSVL